jgi:uncharacterized protein YciI
MTTSDPAGPGRVDETHSGLQKLYYICFTEPAGSLEDLERHLDEHKAYLVQLERAGLLFAAGPLLDENYRFHGPGMIVLNATSRAQAESIVRADPFHARGVRRWRIVPWQVNEGSLQLRMTFSDSRFTFK